MTWLRYSGLGVPKRVVLDTQPTGAVAGIPFVSQPTGHLVDGSGVLAGVTATVTATKASGTGTLSGTVAQATVNGAFSYTDLQMDTPTATVTLDFASAGLVTATSTAFNVTQSNTTIGIASGAITLVGTAATLSRTRVCACGTGAIAIAGTAVTLTGPGGSGWLANKPSGYTTVLQDYAFDGVIPASADAAVADASGWRIKFNDSGNTSRVADSTGPISPGYAMQNFYPTGSPSGSGVGDLYRSASTGINEIYIAFMIWHDANFEQHPISTKLFYWEDGNLIVLFNSDASLLAYYNGGSTYTSNIDNSASMTDFRGKWANIEIQIQRGASGRARIWLNGTLRLDRSLSIATISGLSELKIASTWGGGGSAKTRDSWRRIDHVYIASP